MLLYQSISYPQVITMKRFIIPILLLLSSCTVANEPLSIIPQNTDYPLEIEKDFLATFEHKDLGSTGLRSVAQSGKLFVMSFTDDATGQKAVCDNLDGKSTCVDSLGTTLANDTADSIIRVTVKSVRRLIAREYSITAADKKESVTPPSDLRFDDTAKAYAPFAPFLTGKKDLKVDFCTTFTQNSESERENLCYAGDVVAAYTYVQGSSIVPLTLQRTLYFYKEQSLSQEELKTLKASMIEAMKK